MTIDQMCAEANRAVIQQINRSAGQHMRHMHAPRNAEAPTSADLYAMSMESDTAYRFAAWLCKQAGVAYPPTQEKTS